MPNRLSDAISPYLRSHADNPVDWFSWGPEAFAEAERRDVPVLVSIGYATCHWCHVMARETFSDPVLAGYLNDNFVSVKVDREEHPDVDSSYLASAGAFTANLGWPLTVFVTPRGRAFFAGTYFPPLPTGGLPSFRQVLDAVLDAWTTRRGEVEDTAGKVAEALATGGARKESALPIEFDGVVAELIAYEDREFGGFGVAPKFPVAPVLLFLLGQRSRGPASLGHADARDLAERTLDAMATGSIRDTVEGGFFRYATQRDWSDPHYERMLYDNAQLLTAYALRGSHDVASGIASFLLDVLRQPGGAFASAQDSESTVAGVRVEGGYYALDRAGRAAETPPALDAKVLTGWNGLAIDALATSGSVLGREDWIASARDAADFLLANHRRADGTLIRASIGNRESAAFATLEDYGMLAAGLLALAAASGEVRYAEGARALVDACLIGSAGTSDADDSDAEGSDGEDSDAAGADDSDSDSKGADDSDADRPGAGDPADTARAVDPAPTARAVFLVPRGADPVLAAQGLALETDPSEGAYPSGLSAMAAACHRLYLFTGDAVYRGASIRALESIASLAVARPISFGASLAVMTNLAAPSTQLVVVDNDARSELATIARGRQIAGGLSIVVTPAQSAAFEAGGFGLFAGRTRRGAWFCEDFVCRLPVTTASALVRVLSDYGEFGDRRAEIWAANPPARQS